MNKIIRMMLGAGEIDDRIDHLENVMIDFTRALQMLTNATKELAASSSATKDNVLVLISMNKLLLNLMGVHVDVKYDDEINEQQGVEKKEFTN